MITARQNAVAGANRLATHLMQLLNEFPHRPLDENAILLALTEVEQRAQAGIYDEFLTTQPPCHDPISPPSGT